MKAWVFLLIFYSEKGLKLIFIEGKKRRMGELINFLTLMDGHLYVFFYLIDSLIKK